MKAQRALTVVAVAAVLLACGRGSSDRTINGRIVLEGADVGRPASACDGREVGASDLVAGADVVVTNEKSETVATTSLDPGELKVTGDHPTPSNGMVSTREFTCIISFVAQVPDAKFYGFEVAGRNRVQFSAADIDADEGRVTLAFE